MLLVVLLGETRLPSSMATCRPPGEVPEELYEEEDEEDEEEGEPSSREPCSPVP